MISEAVNQGTGQFETIHGMLIKKSLLSGFQMPLMYMRMR